MWCYFAKILHRKYQRSVGHERALLSRFCVWPEGQFSQLELVFINENVTARQGCLTFNCTQIYLLIIRKHLTQDENRNYESCFKKHKDFWPLPYSLLPPSLLLSSLNGVQRPRGQQWGEALTVKRKKKRKEKSAWEAVVDLMSETEMAVLIKLVWLSEIGSLLGGKENRKGPT